MKLRNIFATAAVSLAALGANAIGWPANYEGVMLQGFYWDSVEETKWTNLESQADELSEYFSLIWIPNSAKAAQSHSMGYDPVYWFSQYITQFGNPNQLKSMINTYKAKGVGIIADVVINHRCGRSSWMDFPSETWNGKTYQLNASHVCRNDDMINKPDHVGTPTGAYDTGEDAEAGRDLDHTSATVQDNCKNYCKFLIDEMGYTGFRLDMVKGYAPQYTKMYNQYAKPKFSVGEYFDGNYDAVAAWIEGTGKESAAFDFPFKYACNNAFGGGLDNLNQLVWMAGSNPQPAGMIHNYYQQLAVTFIDNHDTYRDHNRFGGNVLAANAFMLASPGTPCVFLAHWVQYKDKLKPMIKARRDCGVTNTSAVKVLKAERNCYMAEIYGTKGTMAVRIGNTSDVPSGYSSSNLRCSGNGYAIWTKGDVNNGGGGNGGGIETGDPFKVYFDNGPSGWTTPYIHYWGASESTWPGNPMTRHKGNVWVYEVPAGTYGCLFNAGDGDATKTSDFSAEANHIYTTAGDQGVYDGGEGNGGGNTTPGNFPETLYLIGNVNGATWDVTASLPCDTNDGHGEYHWRSVTFDDAHEGMAYFSFVTTQGPDWDFVNDADRYGASSPDELLTGSATIVAYPAFVSAAGALAWMTPAGQASVTANLSTMTVSLGQDGIDAATIDLTDSAELYNLQGMRVAGRPAPGIYLRRSGASVAKVIIR